MALNLDAMKAKLDKLNGKGDGGKKNFWRPEEGESNIHKEGRGANKHRNATTKNTLGKCAEGESR